MKCPVCKDVTLLMSEKNGVEIDYCPECRGIWLDRGELDKIVERAGAAQRDYRAEYGERDGSRSRDDYRERDRRDERCYQDERVYREDKYYKEHKRKKSSPMSALSDIMEIFGGD